MWSSTKIIVDGIQPVGYDEPIMLGDECPVYGGKITGIVVEGYLLDSFVGNRYRTVGFEVGGKIVSVGKIRVNSVMYHKEKQ